MKLLTWFYSSLQSLNSRLEKQALPLLWSLDCGIVFSSANVLTDAFYICVKEKDFA